MTVVIDIDRGVTIRQIVKFDAKNEKRFDADMKYGGLTVYMYKQEPGVYYDVHGKKVPDGIAKLAGYPVDKHAKARAKQIAMKDFEKKLAAELAIEVEVEEILAEAGDWKVIAMPMDRAKIVDRETGELVTAVPMPKKDAFDLLVALTKASDDAHTETAKTVTEGGQNGRKAS